MLKPECIGTFELLESERLPQDHEIEYTFVVQAYKGPYPSGLFEIATIKGNCLVDAIANYLDHRNDRNIDKDINRIVIGGYICDFYPLNDGEIINFTVSTARWVKDSVPF